MTADNRKTIDYSLSIHTKNERYAGTDNDVFITVYGLYNGKEVQTPEINLSALVNGDAFERNDTHNLSFQWADIGRPTKIKLRLSNNLLDDWYFDYCTIKRNGPETATEDSEINKTVKFNGNKKFERKSSYMYDADLGVLKEEIVRTTTKTDNGGTEFLTLSNGSETSIRMTFEREQSMCIEQSTIVQNGKSHTIGVGGEIGYEPGDEGGFGGKGSFSYGFSYNTLESATDTTTQSISNKYAKEASITIRAKEDEESTYAIVYEQTKLEVVRERKDDKIRDERTDLVNLGRRVRAVLPLSVVNGKLVYISKTGQKYEKDNLWEAVK